MRLEAAALGGKTVYFEAVYPWTRPPRTAPTLLTATERGALVPIFFILAAMIVGAVVFAQRNVRAGRGDRRGALRLSAFVFAAMFVSWFFGERHVATLWEVALLLTALSWALLTAAFCWLGYLAVEPFLRRRWPEVLVTWTRLLAGEFRDPLVGRDVLIGCAAGCLLATWGIGALLVPEWLGLTPDVVPADLLGVAYGVQEAVPLLVWRVRSERDDRPRRRILPAPAPSRAAVPASGRRRVRAQRVRRSGRRRPSISGSRFPPRRF